LTGTKCISSNIINFSLRILPNFTDWSTATSILKQKSIFFNNWNAYRISLARYFGGIYLINPWLITMINITQNEIDSTQINLVGECSTQAGLDIETSIKTIKKSILSQTLDNSKVISAFF
jgi:hypothetical protein